MFDRIADPSKIGCCHIPKHGWFRRHDFFSIKDFVASATYFSFNKCILYPQASGIGRDGTSEDFFLQMMGATVCYDEALS